MEFHLDSDYNVQGSQKDSYNLSSSNLQREINDISICYVYWKVISPHSLYFGRMWDVEIKILNHRLRKRQICYTDSFIMIIGDIVIIKNDFFFLL